MNGNGSGSDGFNTHNPVDKFEEAFMSCLSALTKEDTLTNVDRDEIRVDVEQGIFNVIDSARTMEAYFLKKRLEISAQKPELLIKDDANELRLELIRKDELLKKNYEKINHWQSILSDVQAVTAGKQIPPGQAGNQQNVGYTATGLGQQLSQGPHTPQGPMTPTGGRPNTPGSGRPLTPGGSGGVRMQTSTNIGYQHPIPQIGSPHLGQSSGLQEINPDTRGRDKSPRAVKGLLKEFASKDEDMSIEKQIVPEPELEIKEKVQDMIKNRGKSVKRKRGDKIPSHQKPKKQRNTSNRSKGYRKNSAATEEACSPQEKECLEDLPEETITVAVVVREGISDSRPLSHLSMPVPIEGQGQD